MSLIGNWVDARVTGTPQRPLLADARRFGVLTRQSALQPCEDLTDLAS